MVSQFHHYGYVVSAWQSTPQKLQARTKVNVVRPEHDKVAWVRECRLVPHRCNNLCRVKKVPKYAPTYWRLIHLPPRAYLLRDLFYPAPARGYSMSGSPNRFCELLLHREEAGCLRHLSIHMRRGQRRKPNIRAGTALEAPASRRRMWVRGR